MSTASRPVGVVGIGLIGSAVARRLLAAGLPVAGYDIDAGRRNGLAALGGRQAGSLAELGSMCDRFVLAVFDTQQVEDVIEAPDGLLEAVRPPERATFVTVSTCDPQRIAALGERVAARGALLIECPLSGTSDQVARGEGVGLTAGNEARLAQVDDILGAICKRRYFLGPLGNGNRAKLAVNLILGLNRAALAEGLVLAERLGLPLDSFLEVARGSAAYSQVMDVKGGKMIARDFTPHGKIAQSYKDFSLILAAAERAGQHLPLASVYRSLMEGSIRHGEAEWDNAAVIEQIRRLTAGAPQTSSMSSHFP
jgi:3-hydroxyisobutyrate dehydrogenase-like beta-hydroxyacid dehydrogenase